jgi:hypothetical protein
MGSGPFSPDAPRPQETSRRRSKENGEEKCQHKKAV